MITLTDNAVEKLSTLITGSRKLRVLVKGTGCSGMAYHLEYNIMNTDLYQKKFLITLLTSSNSRLLKLVYNTIIKSIKYI